MGRTLAPDLAKALKMAAERMDEFEAWQACGEPATWGNAQRAFKAACEEREAAPATVDTPPPAAAAARGSRTAPTAPAAAKRGTAPHAARRTGTLHATKMRKTSKQLETAERDQRAWRDLVSMSVHLVGWRLSMARSLCIRAVPGHGSVGGDRYGRQ